MKKFYKKLLSVILAVIMAVVPCALSFGALGANYAPYTETDDYGNVKYYRLSGGKYVDFDTDFYQLVENIRGDIISHEQNIEYRFATTIPDYYYDTAEGSVGAAQACDKLFDDIMSIIFGVADLPATYSSADNLSIGGEYLFKSSNYFRSLKNSGKIIYYDSYYDKIGADAATARYCTFSIKMNVDYFTTTEQEELTESFARWFSSNYLSSTMTKYQIVKTIYDFVVRNTTYDNDVFHRNDADSTVQISDERYNIAHSAFGAIYGNILDKIENDSQTAATETGETRKYKRLSDADFKALFDYNRTVTDEPVLISSDNGLAVCEGYSKLFYYLCTYNGIPCHIVDGDYYKEISGKDSDPHEWNFVKLQDESGDGEKWFQVDCTRAAQNSYKQIYFNNYNYFLGGKESVYFGSKNHQQAYLNKGADAGMTQLYDWWEDTANTSSHKNYVFAEVKLNQDKLDHGYILKRTTHNSEDNTEQESYIYCDKNGNKLIEINEEGMTLTNTQGFVYSGHASSFDVYLPYVVNRFNIVNDSEKVPEGEYTSPLAVINRNNNTTLETVTEKGNYRLHISGADNTGLDIDFDILSRDMSRESIEHDCVIVSPNNATYIGKAIEPVISITDAKRNSLVKNRDYSVYYTMNGANVDEIKQIGDYVIHIYYMGNYTGEYTIDFSVGSINLDNFEYEAKQLNYYPKPYREKYGYSKPSDYYGKAFMVGLVNDVKFENGVNVNVTTTNSSLDYNSSGKFVLTGIAGSNVDENTSLSIDYTISKKYDISFLDGQPAETGEDNPVYYTGKPIKPAKYNVLDSYLVRGVDYRIVSYSNNVNPGIASVTIEGIGGCTGTVTMKFPIYSGSSNPSQGEGGTSGTNDSGGSGTSVTANYVKPSASGNTIRLSCYKYTYNGGYFKPAVTFKNSSGKAVSTYYYTVRYPSKNVGKGYAVIDLRNGYEGSFWIPFDIVPKGTTLSSVKAAKKAVTVKWKKQATQTTGYQIQYSTSSKFKKAKTVTVSKNKTVSKKITKLKSKKKYYFRVRTYKKTGGKTYYSSWSKAKKVKVK